MPTPNTWGMIQAPPASGPVAATTSVALTPFHFVPCEDEVLLNKANQAMKRFFPENLETNKLRGAVMDFIQEIGLVPCPLEGGHGWLIKT